MAAMGLEGQMSRLAALRDWLGARTVVRAAARRPIIVATLNVALIWSLALLLLWQDYRQSVDQWKAFAATFSLALAAHVQDTQAAAQLVIRNISEWVRQDNIQTEEQFRQSMGTWRVFNDIREYIVGLPQLGEVLIIAANGDVLNSTLAFPATRPNLADDSIVKSAAPARAPQPGLSTTQRTNEGSRPMFHVVRWVEDGSGRLLGIVAVGIDANSFATFVWRVPLAPDSWGSLLRADGTLLATSLPNPQSLGKRYENSRSYRLFTSGQSGKPQFAHAPAPFNPAASPTRIVVATAIEGFPAYVSVSVGESAFLAPLRSHFYWVLGIALLLTVVTAVACLRALRLVEQAEAAHRLDLERQVLAAIVDTPSALTAVIDRRGRVVHCNARFRELFGAEGEARDVLDNPAFQGTRQIVAFAAGNGQATAQIDLEMETPNREARVLRCSLSRQTLADTGDCVVMVGHDETERRQVQRTIALSAKLVTLGEITTSIAHEVSQPLNVIHMSAQNALMEATPDPTGEDRVGEPLSDAEFRKFVVDKLRRIVRQVDRASEIISLMRIFSRRANEAPQPFDVREVCRNAVSLLNKRFQGEGIDVHDQLPAEPLIADGHQLILEQAMIYLLRNASEALAGTPPGKRSITLTAHSAGNRIVLRIGDSGPGVPAAIRERIFEPFFTTKPAEKHPGLGLAIVYGIIRDAGGSIELLGDEPGAIFKIDLPQGIAA